MKPKLIIFDMFGTLVKFGIYRHPFRQLLMWARDTGRKPLPDDARTIMTIDGDIHQIAANMRINASAEFLFKLGKDIESELASLALYEDVIPVLDELQRRGIPLAICSNLAKPYGAVIDHLLNSYDLKLFLSYECGLIKPDVSIYRKIIATINVKPKECLFVGDSYLMDCLGPREFGMQSLHLQRQHATINAPESITTLLSILDRLA